MIVVPRCHVPLQRLRLDNKGTAISDVSGDFWPSQVAEILMLDCNGSDWDILFRFLGFFDCLLQSSHRSIYSTRLPQRNILGDLCPKQES